VEELEVRESCLDLSLSHLPVSMKEIEASMSDFFLNQERIKYLFFFKWNKASLSKQIDLMRKI
jgi:hypothetical protein